MISKKIICIYGTFICVICFAVVFSFGAKSFAEDYPDAISDNVITGNKASTEIGLKIDETQLSFTAPVVINYAMKSDGSFVYPTDGKAKFTNNSVFDLKIKKYDVVSDVIACGTSSDSFLISNSSNVYKLKVVPGNSDKEYEFAVSGSADDENWVIPYSTNGANCLSLKFCDGLMKNITSNTWTNGHALQSVQWTVSAS